MALYGMTNFTYGDVAAAFNDTQTTLQMKVGHTDRFTTFPYIAVLWNLTDYTNPHEAFQEAGDAEIIEITSKSGDEFDVIIRGQDGTTAINSTSGKVYRVGIIATRSQWDKVCRAEPDGTGPFDGILEGSAGAVADAVFRFVKDNAVDDCIGSIQGSDTDGDNTALWIGSPAEVNRLRFNLNKNAAVGDTFSAIMNSIEFITFRGGDPRLGFQKASPGQVGGAEFGETTTFDKMNGWISEGGATISGGVINDVNTHLVRVSAEGGPGSDDLDEINLDAADIPQGSRVLLIIEPQTTAHNITVRDKFIAGGSANISLKETFEYLMQAQGDQLWLLSDGTANDEWREVWRTPRQEFVHINDQKAAPGGTFTSGAWRTRDLNTTVSDTEGLTSLAANVITIEQGTYEVIAWCPAYRVNGHVCRLQNVTDASTLISGINAFASSSATGDVTYSVLHGRISIPSGGRDLELQHQCVTTKVTNGFGGTVGVAPTEVYSSIQFKRFVPRS